MAWCEVARFGARRGRRIVRFVATCVARLAEGKLPGINMKAKLLLTLLSWSAGTVLHALGANEYKLGNRAVILETQQIKTNRTLILWMVHPVKHPRDTPSEPYSCPEY